MSQPLRLLETSSNPPARADVVVIGGGIIGVFAAYYLARRGLSVAVVEKGRIGAEQSSRNWGWCRQQNRDARELPMATKSLDLWEQFAPTQARTRAFQALRVVLFEQRRRRTGPLGRWRDFAKTAGVTRTCSAVAKPPSAGRRPDALEGRRLLAQRWHRRSGQGGARRGRCADEARRQRPPAVRRPRHRVGRRPRQRRRHRSGHHQDPHRNARRRCMGILVLPPARHPLSPRHGSPIHRACVAGEASLAGHAAHRQVFPSPAAATAATRWPSAAAGAWT
jgi:choline dehydrogenase-like flavoprotein